MLLNHNHNLRTLHVVMLCFVSLAGNVNPAPAGFVEAEQAEDQRATNHRQSLIGGNSLWKHLSRGDLLIASETVCFPFSVQKTIHFPLSGS